MRKLYLSILCLFASLPALLAQSNIQCSRSHGNAMERYAIASASHTQLMNKYDVTFYKLDLNLERNSKYISGTVTIQAKAKASSLSTFGFELHPNFTISSVTINGVQRTATRSGSDVSVPLASTVPAYGKVTAVIQYRGTAPSTSDAGFNTAQEYNWGNFVTWSLSEPYAAYEWWPTKQVLSDKADSVHVFVTTASDNKVGSNGLLTRVVDLGTGKKRHEWKSRYPIAYYLISVAVSNYDEYNTSVTPAGATKAIPIVNYVYRGSLSYYKNEIDRTGSMLAHFSTLFNLYPFAKEKYGHTMAPMGGGMEHQTMTTQSTFNFTLTAHELAHQWWGDNVTCGSWQDIWLNEGFASYGEYLAIHKLQSATQAASWMQSAHSSALSVPTGSLRVTDTTSINRIFDSRLCYKKGASVVHMLRFMVNNDTQFFQAIRNYQTQYSGKTARTADLKRVFEQTTGKDLTYFFNQWYSGQGHPDFAVEWNQQYGRLLIVSKQKPSSSVTPLFKTDMEYRLTTTTGDTLIRVSHTQLEQRYVIRTKRTVQSITVDPNNWVLNTNSVNRRNTSLIVPTTVTAVATQPTEAGYVLYPNPTSNDLKFSNLPFVPTQAKVIDMTGRVKKQYNFNQPAEKISVADMPARLYYLVLSDGKSSLRRTFFKVDR